MAKFDFEIPADFIKQLNNAAAIDEFGGKMIDEAMPIVERNLKKELEKHRRTGNMINSVKIKKASKNKYGWFGVVRPTGLSKTYKSVKGEIVKRKVPVRNMEILAHLEYGTKHQSPKPVLTKVIRDSESAVIRKMQEVFDREVLNK